MGGFDDTAIAVRVKHTGEFEELLPLLVPADASVSTEPGLVTMATRRGRFVVRFNTRVATSVEPQPVMVLDKKLVVVRLAWPEHAHLFTKTAVTLRDAPHPA
jgi:hypothetical protein